MKPRKVATEEEPFEISPFKKGFKSHPRSTPPMDSEESRQKSHNEGVKVVEF